MVIVLIIICAASCLMLYWQSLKRRAELAMEDMMGVKDEKSVPKLEQIRVLEELEVCFAEDKDKQDFIMGCGYEMNDYLAYNPYYGLLTIAGSLGILDCVYSTGDRECICIPDIYGKILEELKRISQVNFEKIAGYDKYRVSFTLNGDQYQWEGKHKGDWIDTTLAGFLNQILEKEGGTSSRFYLDDSHEAPIFIWGTKEKIRAVNIETNLKFRHA